MLMNPHPDNGFEILFAVIKEIFAKENDRSRNIKNVSLFVESNILYRLKFEMLIFVAVVFFLSA